MQLTKLDRWLRETLVYETNIFTISSPASLPAGVREGRVPSSQNQFKFLFIARDTKSADLLIAQLKANNQMFSTRIVERDAWYVPIVAPKEKSVTWRIVWFVIFSISAVGASFLLRRLLQDPDLQKILSDSWEMIKG